MFCFHGNESGPISTLLDVLRASDLIELFPKRLVEKTQGLTLLEPPLAVSGFTKLAAWHARTHEETGHRWVRALLFQTCGVTQDPAAERFEAADFD